MAHKTAVRVRASDHTKPSLSPTSGKISPAPSRSAHPRPLRRLFSVPKTAELLDVSIPTIRQWIWLRKIESVRLGRSVRVSEETIEQLIASGTVPAIQ